jgi:hypothetical protein
MTTYVLRILILTAGLTLTTLCAVAQPPQARPGIDDLLAKLPSGRLDESDLWNLESQPVDLRTIPALKATFQSSTEKRERQWIAGTLLRLGERAGPYFDFLAGYATEAIDDRTPSFIKYDSNGHSIRAEFSAAFENWCALNGKDPRAVATIQFLEYPKDVLVLAQVDDPRARDLFRRGLESPNVLVVAYSVQGLARLHDSAALSLVARVLERLPSEERYAVSRELPWFETPEAAALMERVMPDRRARDYERNMVQQQRLDELKRVLTRTGSAAHK